MVQVWIVHRYWDDRPAAVTASWDRALETVYAEAVGMYATSEDVESRTAHDRIGVAAPVPANWAINTFGDESDPRDADEAEVVLTYQGGHLAYMVTRHEVIA